MADDVVSNTIALIKRAGSSPASSTRNYVLGFLTAYCPLDYESAQIIIEKLCGAFVGHSRAASELNRPKHAWVGKPLFG